jgi:tetratricopeptide (TPR) repeat protein
VASHLAGKNVVDLDEMHIDDAEQMLRNLLEKPKILSDHENTKELLHTLTCLPLAIVQAASYLNKNDESITTYLKLLRQPEDNVIKLLSEAFNDQGRYKTALNPIATTWLVSFQQIKRENPLAARYLAFASCLSEKNIPQSLFARRSEKEMVDALGVLRGYGFFTRHDDSNVDNPVGPLYDMHRLVRLATRNWLKDQKSLTRWTARAFQRMVAAFPAAEWATRNVWMLYMPHAQMLCDSEQCQDLRERYELLYEMAVCLGWTGKDNDAVGLLKIVYRWAEPTLADDNGFKIKVCASLGDYLERLGRHVEAEGYVNRALEKSRRALGREHTVSITCMIIMGKIYKEQGCWQQAESVLKEGLEAGKKVWGPQHRDVLTANAGLAGVYMNTGQLHEVERIQVEVVELSKKYVGPEHPQTMTAMSDLSRTYREQGRLDKAEKLGLEVCEASERVLGPEHPTTFYALDKLSRVYYAQDRMKAAEEIASKCLGGMSRVLGTEHRQTMESMDLLANIWTDQARLEGAADAQDQLKGAEKMASECLENKSRVLGREHWQTLQTMELLAWIRTDQGRLEEAIELMRECVESSTQTFGTENWRTKGRSEALKEWQQQLAVQAGDANPLSATESSSRVAEEEVEEAPEKPENTLGGTESSSHQQQQHGPQAQRSQQQLEPSKRRRFLNRLVSRKKEDPSKSRE